MYTKIWAHRGASHDAPENTLEAFKLAIEQGADGIELDVQLTKDGKLVVIHDETLERVSNGSGYVKDYTLEELRQFSFNKLHPEYKDVIIPTLEEVYKLLKPTSLTINVELKTGIFYYPGIEEKVLDLARKMKMEKQIMYSSFNHLSVLRIKQLEPKAITGLLYADGFVDVPSYAVRLGAQALHPAGYHLQDPMLVKTCKEKGLALHVWTVDEEEHIKKLIEYRVEAIITNKPEVAKRVSRMNMSS